MLVTISIIIVDCGPLLSVNSWVRSNYISENRRNIIFLLGPNLLKHGDRRKRGSSDTNAELSVRWSNDLDINLLVRSYCRLRFTLDTHMPPEKFLRESRK